MESSGMNKKMLMQLPFRVFLISDAVAYLVNIPVTIAVIFITLDVSGGKILFFSGVVFIAVCAAGVLTVVQLKTFFAPVLAYFTKLTGGEHVSDEEYLTAKIRFYSAPLKRAVSGVIAWVVLMPVGVVLLTVIFHPSLSAKVIIFSLLAIDILTVGCLYYVGIDWQIRKIAKSGAFSRKAAGEENVRVVKSSSALALIIIGIFAILCALMIPIVNGLLYNSAFAFVTSSMRSEADEIVFAADESAGRYNKIVSRMAADLKEGGTHEDALSRAAAECGDAADSVYIIQRGDRLSAEVNEGNADADLLNDGRFAGAIRGLTSGRTDAAAVKSPVTGKPAVVCAKLIDEGRIAAVLIKQEKFADGIVGKVQIGKKGYVFLADRTGAIAVYADSKAPVDSFLPEGEGGARESWSGTYTENGVVMAAVATKPGNSGLRAVAAVPNDEIEQYSFGPVLFMCIFLSIGLVIIGYGVYRILRLRLRPLDECREIISAMGHGDLSMNAVSYSRDDIGSILSIVTEFTEKLRSTIWNIQDVAGELASASGEMTQTSTSFSDNAQGQAASVEEVTATAEEITAGMQSISKGTEMQFSSLARLLEKISELADLINRNGADVEKVSGISRDISEKAAVGGESLRGMNES
ncbi:MAG: hypothetical protein ACRCUT_06695, partial [Spirochaetota bacterium]